MRRLVAILGVAMLVATACTGGTPTATGAPGGSAAGTDTPVAGGRIVAGATPILADGTSFYYSDYNNSAKKMHYRDKWPCCSGTFPQLTADYGISSYYKSQDGIYVNLFVPSRVSWMQGNSQCKLTQTTDYPHAETTEFAFSMPRSETFSVYVRIPAWAGAKTSVAVNGRRAEAAVEPGKFMAIRRTWNDGDRVEIEFEMPLRLESIDDQNRNTVALVRGPLALFAVDEIPARITRQQLLAATKVAKSSHDWRAQTDSGVLTLRPFAAIMSEGYRLYQRVEA